MVKASQLRRLRLIQDNQEGVLHQRSQEVAIERAPRPNRTNAGYNNLVTGGPSVEPSKGVAILHQAQGQEACTREVVQQQVIEPKIRSLQQVLSRQ